MDTFTTNKDTYSFVRLPFGIPYSPKELLAKGYFHLTREQQKEYWEVNSRDLQGQGSHLVAAGKPTLPVPPRPRHGLQLGHGSFGKASLAFTTPSSPPLGASTCIQDWTRNGIIVDSGAAYPCITSTAFTEINGGRFSSDDFPLNHEVRGRAGRGEHTRKATQQ